MRIQECLPSGRCFWLLFAVFALIRLLLIFIQVEPLSDAGWYFNTAVSIASGQGYIEAGHPTAYWPVGWPGMLAFLFWLFGASTVTVFFANMTFATIIFVIVYHATSQMGGDRRATCAALLMMAVYPNHAAYVPIALSELFFTAVLLLSCALLLSSLRLSMAVLAGILFGVAILTKPQILLFFPFLAAVHVLSVYQRGVMRLGLMRSMVCALFMVLTVLPWSVRNYVVLGDWVMVSTNGGTALLNGNNARATGGHMSDDQLAAYVAIERTVENQVEYDRQARSAAIAWIFENPSRFVTLIPAKIWHLWAKDGEVEWEYQRGYLHYESNEFLFRTFRIMNQIFYFAILCLFAYVVFRRSWAIVSSPNRWRCGDEWFWLSVTYVVYITMIGVVFNGQPRYHFSAMPLMIIIAAQAADRLRGSRRWSSLEDPHL